MLGRRQINATVNTHAPLRSSLADAVFAVEERLLWGGADILRRAFELVKWPFERAAWAIERGLVWPVEERTAELSGPLRTVGAGALALLAVAAGVTGLLWASGSGGGAKPTVDRAAAPVAPPTLQQAPAQKPTKAAPVLHGAVPKFAPEAGDAATKSSGGAASTASGEAANTTAAAPTSSPAGSSVKAESAGPAAIEVAHRFAEAFVLYEIGQTDSKVRQAFAATATPQLTHALLQRPPRLPADAKVPQAKVLNIVPGSQHDGAYTLSISLLRVGVTSELRVEMQRDKKTGKWQVENSLG